MENIKNNEDPKDPIPRANEDDAQNANSERCRRTRIKGRSRNLDPINPEDKQEKPHSPEVLPDEPNSAPVAVSEKETYPLTDSQEEAAGKLIERMQFFFDCPFADSPSSIPTNCNTLLLGPTGSGKTVVAGRAAQEMDAIYLTASVGSWAPLGATESAGEPTLVSILRAICKQKKVVFFLDELDKLYESQSSGDWGTSTKNDVMMLFGRNVNLDQVIRAARERYPRTEIEKLIEKIGLQGIKDLFRRQLFLVAAGTWQKLQKTSRKNRRAACSLHFSQADSSADDSSTLPDQIIQEGSLPEEILGRFHADHLVLEYPSRANLEKIINADELLAKAVDSLGEVVDYERLWEKMNDIGMRAISAYKTDVMMAFHKRVRERKVSM